MGKNIVPEPSPCVADGSQMTEWVVIGSRRYRRFIPFPKPVRDGTVRCIRCGQIDEPDIHEDEPCIAARPFAIRDRMASAYKLHDRSKDGYKGRWRYAVFALIRDGDAHDELLAYFSCRQAAAAFNAKCAAFGEAFAYRSHGIWMAPSSPIHTFAEACR